MILTTLNPRLLGIILQKELILLEILAHFSTTIAYCKQVVAAMVVLQDTFIAQILAHFNTIAAYWKQVVAAIVVLQDTFRLPELEIPK